MLPAGARICWISARKYEHLLQDLTRISRVCLRLRTVVRMLNSSCCELFPFPRGDGFVFLLFVFVLLFRWLSLCTLFPNVIFFICLVLDFVFIMSYTWFSFRNTLSLSIYLFIFLYPLFFLKIHSSSSTIQIFHSFSSLSHSFSHQLLSYRSSTLPIAL